MINIIKNLNKKEETKNIGDKMRI